LSDQQHKKTGESPIEHAKISTGWLKIKYPTQQTICNIFATSGQILKILEAV